MHQVAPNQAVRSCIRDNLAAPTRDIATEDFRGGLSNAGIPWLKSGRPLKDRFKKQAGWNGCFTLRANAMDVTEELLRKCQRHALVMSETRCGVGRNRSDANLPCTCSFCRMIKK